MTNLTRNAVNIIPVMDRSIAIQRLGRNVAEGASVVDAFEANDLLYNIEPVDMYVRGIDGQEIAVPNHRALRRSDTGAVLEVVGDRYEVVNNRDLATYLEPLRQWGHLKTVGSDSNGSAIFAQFAGPDFEVKTRNFSDVLSFFATIIDQRRLGQSLTMEMDALRWACLNGQKRIVRDGSILAPLGHVTGVNEIAAWVGRAAGALGLLEGSFQTELQRLADTRVSNDQVGMIIDAAFQMPQFTRNNQRFEALLAIEENPQAADMLMTSEIKRTQDMARVQQMRDTAWATYEGEVADQGAAGTAYGGYQAVTAVVDHLKPGIRQARSAVFGAGAAAKIRAYATALGFSSN